MSTRRTSNSMETGCTRVLATCIALLFAAQYAAAQPICPLPPPPAIPWCSDLQSTQCFSTDPTSEQCRPRLVLNDPGVAPIIQECECTDGVGCGPLDMIPGPNPGEWLYRCIGDCPTPGVQCELFVNGNGTGSPAGSSLGIPAGAVVTCECPGTTMEMCPLASGYCQTLAQTDCVSDDPANEFCWPKAILGTAAQQPAVDACECFDSSECGPIRIATIGSPPVDYEYSCIGVCPDPNDDCEIHFDFGQGPLAQGTKNILASQVPACATVTCDCAETETSCPLSGDQLCAHLQANECANGNPTDVCAPTFILITGTTPNVMVTAEACECTDFTSCGPINVDPIGPVGGPSDYALSCTGACPPGQPGPCLVFVNGVSTGVANINASALPIGAQVTCDCEDEPPYCPLSSDQLCANLQPTDCPDGGPNERCTPTSITVTGFTPVGVSVAADACECTDFTSCGPVHVDPIGSPPVDYVFTCTGACPPGQPGPCLVFADGVSTGAGSVNASTLPIGSKVTCDCEDPIEVCPLATDFCANFQFTDCITTNGLATLCWPSAVGGGTASPQVFACDCFADECGPVKIEQDPTGQGFIYSCPGPCPIPGEPCEIFFDDGTGPVGTGMNSVNSFNVPLDVIVTCDCGDDGEPDPVVFEFSLDIGSDTELSDPFADGDEGADPGDVYLWNSAAYRPPLQPCGRDGFKDDLFIFGFDPFPNPPDCALPPATAVPVGSGIDPNDGYAQYFDLDGHDQTDFNLQQFVPPTSPLPAPIPQGQVGPSTCVFKPQFLLLSYDDDRAPGWTTGDVPTTSPSPVGNTYGTDAGNDEVVGVTLTAAGPPYGVALSYRPYDEVDIHSDMAPNPLNGQRDDDDVDSLDAVRGSDFCPYWYFTADHEAHLGLDPGDIYLVLGGGAVPVIDDVIHLGLPASTDVDAFEFTWLPVGAGGGSALAVLFSVDEDDPNTPLVDESGGLNPRQIHASFLTGASFPVLQNAAGLRDDIDAITIWTRELLPLCPDADVNCDGNITAADLGVVVAIANWLKPAWPAVGGALCDRTDVNNDANVTAADLGAIVAPGIWLTNHGPCECVTSTPGLGGCPVP